MPILIRAHAMPMVRTIMLMRCFWPAKTCSTAEMDVAGERALGEEGLVLPQAVGRISPDIEAVLSRLISTGS